MNTPKPILSVALLLTALLPLAGCGLGVSKKDIYRRLAENQENSKTRAGVSVATASADRIPNPADAIALRAVSDDDIAAVLNELWRAGLDYTVASRGDDHAVLVRTDTGVRVADAYAGRYASGRGSWAGAVLDGPDGTVTVVAMDVEAPDVDELLDVLAFADGETVVACGLALEDPAANVLTAAGFEVALETPEGDLLLTRPDTD